MENIAAAPDSLGVLMLPCTDIPGAAPVAPVFPQFPQVCQVLFCRPVSVVVPVSGLVEAEETVTAGLLDEPPPPQPASANVRERRKIAAACVKTRTARM